MYFMLFICTQYQCVLLVLKFAKMLHCAAVKMSRVLDGYWEVSALLISVLAVIYSLCPNPLERFLHEAVNQEIKMMFFWTQSST